MDSLEKGCKWTFQPWKAGSTLFGPNDATVQCFNKDFADSLVRESIQNSLDAVVDMSKPVTVEFLFNSLIVSDYPQLFDLKKHLEGCLREYSSDARATELFEPMLEYFNDGVLKTITVSDSNTSGMMYNAADPKCPFSAFSRSVGFSVKKIRGAGGCFGFGKAAYYQMSPIRSIMISSMTQDKQTVFEGAARLCTHPINDVMYSDTGYYDNNAGQPCCGDDIPLDFRRKEPGTSITLLGIYKDAGTISSIEEELTISVLKNFWLAIYEKKLVVKIGENKCIDDTQIKRLFDIYFIDPSDKSSPRHYFEAYSHKVDVEHLHFFEENSPFLGKVELYLLVHPSLKKDRIAFMRKPLMLVEEKSNKTHYGVYALFICRDDKGNEVLSGLEDASHSSWSYKGKRGDSLNRAKEVVKWIDDYVKKCLDEHFGIKGDTASVNIGLGYSEKDIERLIADKTESNNPFETGHKVKLNAEKTGEEPGAGSDTSKGNIGAPQKGQRNIDKAGNKTIGLGHTKKKSNRKGGDSSGGRIRTKASPIVGDNGQPFTLYSPIEYCSPAVEVDGEWYHDLILHVEEDMDNVFIEVKIGTDDGDDCLEIQLKSLLGRVSEKKTGIIEFDHLGKGVQKIRIQFKDKMRHTISLK